MTFTTLLILACALALGFATATGRLSPKHYPVLLAYASGLLIGTFAGLEPGETAVLQTVMRVAVALAIPALLLQTSLAQLRGLGRSGALAGLCVWAGAFAAAGVALGVFAQAPTDVALILAVFTGSLANMQAAGTAMGVPDTTLVAANLGDIVAGGVLFAGLSSVGPGLLRRVLGRGAGGGGNTGGGIIDPVDRADLVGEKAYILPAGRQGAAARLRDWVRAVSAAAGALGVGLGLDALLGETTVPSELVILGTATVVSVGLAGAVLPRGAGQAGARLGDGLMIVFCVLVGTGASLGDLAGEALSWAMSMGGFLAVELGVAVILARALRVDADTFSLALAGAVYSPAFVGPVAIAAGRRDALPVGIVWGLIGLALGTPAAPALVAYFPAPN